MARYRTAQLHQFQRNSRCEDCVHYTKGCPLWMAILLVNEEDMHTPGLDLFIDIDVPCPMFFARSAPIRPSPPGLGDIHVKNLQKSPT